MFVSLFRFPLLSLSLSLSLVSFRISRLSLFVARRKEEERMCIILLRIGHKVKCGQHKDRPARRVSVRHRKSDFSSFSLFSVDIIETSGVWLAFPSLFNFLSTTRQRSFFGFIVIKKKEEKNLAPLVLIASIRNNGSPCYYGSYYEFSTIGTYECATSRYNLVTLKLEPRLCLVSPGIGQRFLVTSRGGGG